MNDDYIEQNNIRELFESLNKNLLLNRPKDIVQHLQESLTKIKTVGLEEYKKDSLKQDSGNIREYECLKGLLRIQREPEQSGILSKGDYKIAILISAPGEVKPLGNKLSHVYANCGYINLGGALKRRIWRDSKTASSRWICSESLMQNGDLVPDDTVLNVLLDELKKQSSKSLIVIEGYPKNLQEVKDFENAIGFSKLIKVIAMDSFANDCRNELQKDYNYKVDRQEFTPQSSERRLANYKAYTLPVLKYFQDSGKLVILENEPSTTKLMKSITEHLFKEVPQIMNKGSQLLTPRGKIGEKINETRQKIESGQLAFRYSSTGNVLSVPLIYTQEPVDKQFRMGNTRLVLLQGAENSGKSTIGDLISESLPGWFHLDFNTILPEQYQDEIKPAEIKIAKMRRYSQERFGFLKASAQQFGLVLQPNIKKCCVLANQMENISYFAIGILLENFPLNHMELCEFLREIGCVDLQLFLDVSRCNAISRYLDYEHQQELIRLENPTEAEAAAEAAEAAEDVGPLFANSELCHRAEMAFLDFMNRTLPTVRYFADRNLSFDIDANQPKEVVVRQAIGLIRSVFYNDS